jgi:hypothetical protein
METGVVRVEDPLKKRLVERERWMIQRDFLPGSSWVSFDSVWFFSFGSTLSQQSLAEAKERERLAVLG